MAHLPSHRASDSDREQVATRLQQATLEGRLTASELDERLGLLYASKTYGELDVLVSDLPAPSPPPPAPARRRVSHWVGPVGAAAVLIAVLGALGGGVHREAAAAPTPGAAHPPPIPGPGPFADAHHAFIVGASAIGVVLVLALCAAVVWLAIHSNKPSELR